MPRIKREALRKELMTFGRGTLAKRWTPEEDEWLEANYERMSAAELAEKLYRTPRAIYARAVKIGLRSQEPDWTIEELKAAFLNARDPKLLKKRSLSAIYQARSRYRPEAHE